MRKSTDLLDAEFEHWHVLGPVLWTALIYAGAGLLDLFAVPPLYVALVGACTSFLAPVIATYQRFAFLLMAAVTGFLTWTTLTTPWDRWPALAAVGGLVLFGTAHRALVTHEKAETPADVLAEKAASKGRYVELLETIGIKGLKESRREAFPAGKTIVLLLPVNGSVTISRLKDATEALDIAAARAGLNATFDFERGASAAEVKMHVFDTDVLAEEIAYPFERRPKSISEPMPLGLYATGEVVEITYREIAALMVGLKGKGKSGLINTHLAYLTGCTDAVVWIMDGKGGETVWPWLQPFLDLVTDRPALNWAAVDEAEYDAMLLAANAVRKFRTQKAWKSGLGPSAQTPAVIVIVEEASVITGVARYGSGQRAQLAQDGVTLGRSSWVDWLFATQRATLDMLGSGAMKSNLDLRYGMGIKEQQDARMIFPDAALAKSLYRLGDDPKYRGTFLMQAPGQNRIMPAKGYWLHPGVIPSVAQANAQWAGELDQGTADYVHEVLVKAGVEGGYYGRWERLCAVLGCDVPASAARVSDVPVAATPEPPRPSPASKAIQDAIAARRTKAEDDEFQSLMGANFADEELTPTTSCVPDAAPPILRMILSVFSGLGNPDALPTKAILDEIQPTMTAKALGRLMGLCNVSPTENIVWNGEPRARGYTRDSIETSIKRGSWTKGAFDWQP